MSRLTWGDISDRRYHAGLDRGVFYDKTGAGRAWPGLVSAYQDREPITGRDIYIDGIRVAQRRPFENHAGRIETFMAPEELSSKGYIFGLSYRTLTDTGYLIHILYNVMATPTQRLYSTDQTSTTPSAWDLSTLKKDVGQGRLSSHLIIDSDVAPAASLAVLEDILYGNDANNSRLPEYDEIMEILETGVTLRVTYLRPYVYRIEGPDDVVVPNGDGTYHIEWPSVIFKGNNVYHISSL